MEIIHADTYEDAHDRIREHKAAAGGSAFHYKIVRSAYEGYSVVVLDPDLFTDMLTGELPAIPQLKRALKMPDFIE